MCEIKVVNFSNVDEIIPNSSMIFEETKEFGSNEVYALTVLSKFVDNYQKGKGKLAAPFDPKNRVSQEVEEINFKDALSDFKIVDKMDNVVNVCSVEQDTGEIRKWVGEESTALCSKPLFVYGKHGKGQQIIKIMIDPGTTCRGLIPNDSAMRVEKMPLGKDSLVLRFGEGSLEKATEISTLQRINIQDRFIQGRFVLSPKNLPGVDLILGLPWMRDNRAVLDYLDNKANTPFLRFADGNKWYFSDMYGPEDSVNMMHIEAVQGNRFIQKNYKSVEVCLVSVQKMLELEGTIKRAEKCLDPVDPRILKELEEFKDIFCEILPDNRKLPTAESGEHKIPLKEGADPVRLRPIPMSHAEQLILVELLKDLIKKGYIVEAPDDAKWAAPVFLLRKAGNLQGVANQWRIITDYRGLNNVTKTSSYTPPAIRDLIDNLVNAKVFSKSDNIGGFYQMPLAKEDQHKTTFVCKTPEGVKKFMFTVACLGLQGCPASYQTWMEEVISGLAGCQVYLDDLVFATKTMEEHILLLREVFTRLRKHRVYLHPGKCEWGQRKIDYLGMEVSYNRIRVSQDKVSALKAYHVPEDLSAVRRFVGFANYLQQFIPHFSAKMSPITDLLQGAQDKKRRKLVWTEGCQQAFDGVIEELANAPGLLMPDKAGNFVVETDASGEGLGACLYQYTNERLVPVWYLSKKFDKAERNYSTRDREALAIVHALRVFKPYLALTPFILYSDHESLANFLKQPDLKTGRDWRYGEIISEFTYEHRYRKGDSMLVPDAISRAFDEVKINFNIWEETDHDTLRENLWNPKLGNNPSVDAFVTSISVEDTRDIEKEYIRKYGEPVYVAPAVAEEIIGETPIAAARVFSNLDKAIREAIHKDSVLGPIFNLAESDISKLSVQDKVKVKNFCVVDDLLYFSHGKDIGKRRLCIPRCHDNGNALRLLMLFEAHNSYLHQGVDKTYARLAERYWWDGMYNDTVSYVRACESCKKNGSRFARPKGMVSGLEIPEQRWDVIHLDWITDLPITEDGFDQILVCSDRVTKYAYLIAAMKTDTAEDTASRLFQQVFCVHGLPKVIVSDRDSRLTAKLFVALMQQMKVKQSMGTSYYHDFNGAAEVLNKTIEVMLRHVMSEDDTIAFTDILPMAQYCYNSAKHKATGMSPYRAMFGFEARNPIDFVKSEVNEGAADDFIEHQAKILVIIRDALVKAQMTMEEYANRKAKDICFDVGEKVYLNTKNLGASHFEHSARKLRQRYLGPYEIIQKVDKYKYKLDLPKDEFPRIDPVFHASLLWKKEELPEHLRAKSEEQIIIGDVHNDNDDVLEVVQQEEQQVLVQQEAAPANVENVPLLPEQLVDVADEEQENKTIWEIEEFVGTNSKCGRVLVKWLNHSADENRWVSIKKLSQKDQERFMVHKAALQEKKEKALQAKEMKVDENLQRLVKEQEKINATARRSQRLTRN